MSTFLQFQGSQTGLFSDLSAGESFPLRIPFDRPLVRERLDMSSSTCLRAERLWAAVSPTDKPRKDGALPPVTSKKHSFPAIERVEMTV